MMGEGLTTPYRKRTVCYETLHRTLGVLLLTRQWTFRFYKRRGISWPAEWLSASQEGLCCMQFVIYLVKRRAVYGICCWSSMENTNTFIVLGAGVSQIFGVQCRSSFIFLYGWRYWESSYGMSTPKYWEYLQSSADLWPTLMGFSIYI
jgi:hypothetical protein